MAKSTPVKKESPVDKKAQLVQKKPREVKNDGKLELATKKRPAAASLSVKKKPAAASLSVKKKPAAASKFLKKRPAIASQPAQKKPAILSDSLLAIPSWLDAVDPNRHPCPFAYEVAKHFSNFPLGPWLTAGQVQALIDEAEDELAQISNGLDSGHVSRLLEFMSNQLAYMFGHGVDWLAELRLAYRLSK